MKNSTTAPAHGVPDSFLNKFGGHVTAVLAGFDRLRFRATLRLLHVPRGMAAYLNASRVLLKDFKAHAEATTERIRTTAFAAARAAGRPIHNLNSPQISKEDFARQIARTDGITDGLIALFTATEACRSYSVRGNRAAKKLELVLEPRRCQHLYHYFQHADFGQVHVRVQTWFPFSVDVCFNGREWLARQMDRSGITYEQCDNCFVHVSDPVRAQALLDDQFRTDWVRVLQPLLEQAHPLHAELARPLGQPYYWTASQTEFATDLLFANPARLAALYPQFVHHGIKTFSCRDVLRFLGHGAPDRFTGELATTLKQRPEGMCLRHRVNGNSLKMYDKQGRVLRIETTIDHPEHFKSFRPKASDPTAPLEWQRVRKSVADLHRRAEISRAANGRYLEALASTQDRTPLHQEAATVCRPVTVAGQRHRALNPWNKEDGRLLEIVSRGEYAVAGFRNRDVRGHLHPGTSSAAERRRQASRITRQLARLRAHGLIKKVSGTHRWQVTETGRRLITALLTARQADVDQLTQLAA